MLPTLELTLLLLLVLAVGIWGVVSGVRLSRRQRRDPVTPQALSALAQPYRGLMGEAVAIYRDVETRAVSAPRSLRGELDGVASRIRFLVARALPQARYGTELLGYLLKLGPGEAQYTQTERAAKEVETELRTFVETLKILRGKVYQILTHAASLSADGQLSRDLEDALIEIGALEEAFAEVRS